MKTLILSLALLTAAAVTPAPAQDFPARPITLVVPQGAGGSLDVLSRVLADRLSADLGQPVVIENKPGAGGVIATAAVAKAAPDGYTIMWNVVASLVPPSVKVVPYDAVKDLTAITPTVELEAVLLASPQLGAKNLKELIAVSKSRPNGVSYVMTSAGSFPHLCVEHLKAKTGMNAFGASVKAPPEGLVEVMQGRIDLYQAPLVNTLALVREGKLVAVANPAGQRAKDLPDVATYAEQGFPDATCTTYHGIWGPAGMPEAVVTKLNEAVYKALADSSAKLGTLGANVVRMSSREFTAILPGEIKKVRDMAAAINLEAK